MPHQILVNAIDTATSVCDYFTESVIYGKQRSVNADFSSPPENVTAATVRKGIYAQYLLALQMLSM
jgi:hypothetical protein